MNTQSDIAVNVGKVTRVTRKELAVELAKMQLAKGMAIFASLEQLTEPKMLAKSRADKTPNTFGKVTKLSIISVILNADYKKQVTNQLKREDKETTEYQRGKAAMQIEYGENNRFIGKNVANERLVIMYRPNNEIKPTSKFFVDDIETDKAKLIDYLPLSAPATNQGTDKEIFWRTVYLDNVKRITIQKQIFEVID